MTKRLLFSVFVTLLCQSAIAQSISSNAPLCADNSSNLELKASGGSTYRWSGPNRFTSTQQNPVIIRPTSSNYGVYYCLIDGKTVLNTFVKVGKNVSFIDANYDTEGGRIFLNSYAAYATNYSWTGPNNYKATGNRAFINDYNGTSRGNYTVTGTDEFGCSVSKTIQIDASDCSYQQRIFVRSKSGNVLKSFGSGNHQFSICENSSVTLEADTAYWGSDLKLQWVKDNKVIANATGVQLQVSEQGNYEVIMTKGSCSYQTVQLKIKVESFALTIARDYVQGNDYVKGKYVSEKEICGKGGSTTLNSYILNNNYLIDRQTITRQWYKDGIILPSSNGNSSLTVTEAGKYQVRIMTGQCEAISDPVTVKAVEQLKPYFYFNVAGYEEPTKKDLQFCNEFYGSVEIHGKALGNGNKKLYRNGVLVTETTDYQFVYPVSQQSATYALETTQGQCKSWDTLRLEYGKTADVSIFKNDYYSSCANSASYYVNPNTTPENGIKWYKDDVLFSSSSGYLKPNSSAIYQAKYENTATGCKGESEKIKVVMPLISTKPFLTIVFPQTKKVALCKNATKTIILNTYFGEGIWKKDGKVHDAGNRFNQTNVSQAGKYWYEYNNGSCTFNSDTLEVVDEEIPKITLTQTCLKDNSFKLNVNATAGTKYNWYQDGVNIAGKDTSITVSKSGKYAVEANRNGCFATSNEVNVGLLVPEVINICNGDSLKLKALSDVSNTFSWTGPNNFKSNFQNPIVTQTSKANQGFYKLSTTDKSGCNFVGQTQIIVNDYPAFTLPKTITACAGSEFTFNQLVPKPLTDSTESVRNYYFSAPNKKIYNSGYLIPSISSKDAGVYEVVVSGSEGGCVVKTTMELIVDASAACRNIVLVNLNPTSINFCEGQTIDIPFATTGTFKNGTIFRAYYEEGYFTNDVYKIKKNVLGTSQQSPIKINGLKGGYNYEIKVESEDGITSLKSRFIYMSLENSSFIIDANGYSRSTECTALPLTIFSNSDYINSQWFLNGDTLKKETGRNLVASKTGTYTFKGIDLNGCNIDISKEVVIGKLDAILISNDANELSCFTESVVLDSYRYYDNVKYTWKRDGVLQSNNTNRIKVTTPGKYTLEVSKETCKVISDTIVVKQNAKKNFNLTAFTDIKIDFNNNRQALIYVNSLGNVAYTYQLFKDNQLFAEGKRDDRFPIKDAGQYFFRVMQGDCEAISNVVDFKGLSPEIPTSKQKDMYFSGSYDRSTNIIQLCDTNSVQYFDGYTELLAQNIVKRVVTAFKDGKVLPPFDTNSKVYPSLLVSNDYSFRLNFRGAGTYSAIEEITLKDSTKLKYTYKEMKVVISPTFYLSSKQPYNVFSCSDSVFVFSYYYTSDKRHISHNWKKDGVIIKQIPNPINEEYVSLAVRQSGTYVLETTYKGGCIGISPPYKVEIGKVNIRLDTLSQILCEGASVKLSGYVNDGGFKRDSNNVISQVFYQWVKDGKDYTSVKAILPKNFYSGGIYDENIVFPTQDPGVYALKVQQGKCQGVSPNVTVKISPVFNTINYADSVLFCQTQSVNLKTTENTTLSYFWERDGGFIKDANKATLEVKEGGVYRSLNRSGACWNYTPKVRAKVLANIIPTAILTGSKEINYADTAKVSIALTSYAPWTFKLSDGKEYTATKSPFEVSLRPQFSTNYMLTEVKNVCGTGTISGTANIKVLVLSSELEEGIDLNIFPVPSKEDVNIRLVLDKPDTMEWTLNNVNGSILGSELQANKSNKHESNVSLKSLPEGVYFLRIQVGEKSLVRKIVKTN